MKVVRTEAELRADLDESRHSGRSIGFVPTMGALHEGHLSLLRRAREDCDAVVLSIFVNPLQFGPGEDLSAYPRTEAKDLNLADRVGVDLAFVPSVDEMFPPGRSTTVSVGKVSEPLEGAARPGHFDAVATVVAKLFNQVRPQRAYFGEKDAQQVAVIEAMVVDLAFPVDVVVCPTVREPDGVAMSSRNAYLSSDDRARARVLWRALQRGRAVLVDGAGAQEAEDAMEETVRAEAGVTLDYARAVDPRTFGPPEAGADVRLVIAARVGSARLIDNVLVTA